MNDLTATRTPDTAYIGHLLNEFAGRVAGVSHVFAVAADGLLLAATSSVGRDPAERLAAAVSGFAGLATQVNKEIEGGGLEMIIVEMVGGYLIILEVPGGSRLAALTNANSDVGQAGYELQRLADRVGEMALTVETRHG